MTTIEIFNSFQDDLEEQLNININDPQISAISVLAPYISDFFMKKLKSANFQYIYIITNKNSPTYTIESLQNILQEQNKKVFIKFTSGRFVHAKLLILYQFAINQNSNKKYLIPIRAIFGSTNWTKGGIKNNIEIMAIISEKKEIYKLYRFFTSLWNKVS